MANIVTNNSNSVWLKAIVSLLLVFFVSVGFIIRDIPFDWFQVNTETLRTEVHTLCGPPQDTTLWDMKGDRWLRSGLFWKWQMLIGFNYEENRIIYSDIWVDIGPSGKDLRLYVMRNGVLNIHI